MGYFAPYGIALPSRRPGWVPPNVTGMLGPCPGAHVHAYPMMPTAPPYAPLMLYQPAPPSWDQLAMINAAYSNSGYPNPNAEWFMDTGASSHVTGNSGTLASLHSSLKHFPSSFIAGNGLHLPITVVGSTSLAPHNFSLHNVLVSPSIVKNLIYVHQFTRDNSVSVEFFLMFFLLRNLV